MSEFVLVRDTAEAARLRGEWNRSARSQLVQREDAHSFAGMTPAVRAPLRMLAVPYQPMA